MPICSAQTFSIDWHEIAGGGGTGTGGVYQISGTIGEHDATAALSGGQYSLTGGFWAPISVVQMPGAPKLLMVSAGPGTLKIVWADSATNTYILQQSATPGLDAWTTSGFAITNGFGTNFCTITTPAGNLFFRLKL